MSVRGSADAGSSSTGTTVRLYSAWFCPYAQRAWMALELCKIPYELVEALTLDAELKDYIKNQRLLEINPKGLVPTVEVTTASFTSPLLLRCAQWANRVVCSPYYRCLVRRDPAEQQAAWTDLQQGWRQFSSLLRAEITEELVESLESNDADACVAAPATAPALGDEEAFFFGNRRAGSSSSFSPSIVDLTVFPWCFRFYVLARFRGFALDEAEPYVKRLRAWEVAMHANPAVQATLPDKEKLLATYARYEQGTANSQVGEAVRQGKEAHNI